MNRRTWKVFLPESDDLHERRYTPTNQVSGAEARRTYVDILGEQNVSYQNNETNHESESHSPKPEQKRNTKCRRYGNIEIRDLYMCAQNNNPFNIERILSEKPEWLNCCDDYGWSPLMVACQAGSMESVQMLVKFRANISIKDKAGNTAFSLAKRNNNYALMKILAMTLENGTSDKSNSSEANNTSYYKRYYCDLCKDHYKDEQLHKSSTIHNFNVSKNCKRKTFYGIPESNKGYQLMLKTGWDKNNGLGPDGDGQKFPVKTSLKLDRKGIGIAGERSKVTHADKELLEAAKKRGNTGYGKRDIERNRRKEKVREKMFRREFYS